MLITRPRPATDRQIARAAGMDRDTAHQFRLLAGTIVPGSADYRQRVDQFATAVTARLGIDRRAAFEPVVTLLHYAIPAPWTSNP